MDGEVAGLRLLAVAFFLLGTYESGQFALSALCAGMLGIAIGLHFYNSSPAKLFLGDGGAQTLGFLLAATAILYNPFNKFPTSSWFVPILLVGVPIFDTSMVFFSRLRRRKPFYQGGRDHSYHRLVALGFSSTRAVHVIHLAALALDCLAFIAVSLPPLWANGIFALCVLMGVASFFFLDRKRICP
jgi:UDP-GlcNAc:undecaprenyl-phosphate GlcNAc-1-phosphate transferase